MIPGRQDTKTSRTIQGKSDSTKNFRGFFLSWFSSWGLGVVVSWCLLSVSVASAAQTLNEYCTESYAKDALCPRGVCSLSCVDSDESSSCEMQCVAKSCMDISSDDCPQKYCQLAQGCAEQNVCIDQTNEENPPECGGLAYSGTAVECCEGFVKRCGIEFFDGTCDMVGANTPNNIPTCLPCGNGICNQFENRCNCPEDCE